MLYREQAALAFIPSITDATESREFTKVSRLLVIILLLAESIAASLVLAAFAASCAVPISREQPSWQPCLLGV